MVAPPILSVEELHQMESLKQFVTRCKVDEDSWVKFATNLGDADFNDIAVFAAISDKDFQEACDACGVGVFKRAALNLLFFGSKIKIQSYYRGHQVAVCGGRHDGPDGDQSERKR